MEGEFRCDYKYSPAVKGWFKHYVIPATWADANLRCTLQGAKLASPLNVGIETEMKNILRNFIKSGSEIFTGLHATFSRGNFYNIEGEALQENQLTWTDSEPNNDGNNETCTTFNEYGEMADRSCDEPRPYICFRSADNKTKINECGTIDPEYELDRSTNSCYKFHTVARTFAGAHFACSAEGGYLTIINTDGEATVLDKLFAKYPDSKLLGPFSKGLASVGAYCWDEAADWRTIHGQTLEEAGYSKFRPGQPNNIGSVGEFCLAIDRDALFHDVTCHGLGPFICEKKPDYPPVCSPLKNQYKYEV
ncbi:hypothetical protein HW555_009794 [Spodoptera exigua]|uniref:C-type lectin domain-containing protein n=1 Tax=Spodoptera exigua TaxID=7107 RepID=A0A835GCD3_SPOEX|nr:hypothetical protein HW555_009794 [Spodoptera exigua]